MGEGFGAPPEHPDGRHPVAHVLLAPVRGLITVVQVPMVKLVSETEQHAVVPKVVHALHLGIPNFFMRPTFHGESGMPTLFGVQASYGAGDEEGGNTIFNVGLGTPGNFLVELRQRLARVRGVRFTLGAAIAEARGLPYYGIGMNTLSELAAQGAGPATYGLRPAIRVGPQIHSLIAPHTWVEAQASAFWESFANTTSNDVSVVFPPSERPGWETGLSEVQEELGLTHDTRPQIGLGPGHDEYAIVSAAQGFSNDAARFIDARAGAAVHLNLGLGTRILTFRVRAEDASPLGHGIIPFTLLPSLGGDWLRGYVAGRFRDRSALLAAAEYEWPLHRLIGAGLFAEAGQVAGAHFDGMSARKLAYDGGMYLRYFPKSSSAYSIFLRLGFGTEGVAFAIGAGLTP
jgi:hypothetical protein